MLGLFIFLILTTKTTHFKLVSFGTIRSNARLIISPIHKQLFPTFPPPAAENNDEGGTTLWSKLKSLLAKARLN